MSAPLFGAAAGGAKLSWDIYKSSVDVVFDEKAPTGKRIAYGTGGTCAIGGIIWAMFYFLKK